MTSNGLNLFDRLRENIPYTILLPNSKIDLEVTKEFEWQDLDAKVSWSLSCFVLPKEASNPTEASKLWNGFQASSTVFNHRIQKIISPVKIYPKPPTKLICPIFLNSCPRNKWSWISWWLSTCHWWNSRWRLLWVCLIEQNSKGALSEKKVIV